MINWFIYLCIHWEALTLKSASPIKGENSEYLTSTLGVVVSLISYLGILTIGDGQNFHSFCGLKWVQL